jgi:cystathionine beta-lyase/cystathionine gamma-synthase
MAAAVMAHVKTGDHIVAARVLYGKTLQMLDELSDRFGVQIDYADATRPETFAAVVNDRTRIAIVETLSNPLLEVTDFDGLRRAIGDVPLLVDSTFTTPALFRPLEHGADLVFHSASKYLNGHGDVMLGLVAGDHQTIDRVADLTSLFGMNANPFDSWLALRGLRTLELRMPRVSETAQTVAEFLDQHPAIERVFYPGLQSHPQHKLAQRLFPDGCSGMLSFELKNGNREGVSKFMRALPSIPFSPTLADARTTISYPAGTSHVQMTTDRRAQLGVTDGLVRLSVGLESAELLIDELKTALAS